MDDGPLLTREPVEQGRLADIRPADDRDGRDTGTGLTTSPPLVTADLCGLGISGFRQLLDHVVEQIADAPSVQGAHHRRLAEPETCELPGIDLPPLGVDLVRDQDDCPACAPDQLRHDAVVSGHPRGRVEHQQHEVCLTQGP